MITSKTKLLHALPVLANQETVKHILIGDYGAIVRTQEVLATLRYAEKILWTEPQPIGTTSEYISVLIKRSAPSTKVD